MDMYIPLISSVLCIQMDIPLSSCSRYEILCQLGDDIVKRSMLLRSLMGLSDRAAEDVVTDDSIKSIPGRDGGRLASRFVTSNVFTACWMCKLILVFSATPDEMVVSVNNSKNISKALVEPPIICTFYTSPGFSLWIINLFFLIIWFADRIFFLKNICFIMCRSNDYFVMYLRRPNYLYLSLRCVIPIHWKLISINLKSRLNFFSPQMYQLKHTKCKFVQLREESCTSWTT